MFYPGADPSGEGSEHELCVDMLDIDLGTSEKVF